MPRIARGLVDNYIYHILNRGNNKQEVFHKEEDYRLFIDLIIKAKSQYSVKIFAYCLMPSHFHIVLMVIKAEEFSKFMQWLMTSHVRRYHKAYKTTGHIWQGRYKSFMVQENNHLLTLLRYVEGNPVRAGIVKSAKNWKWSSHKEVIGDSRRILVERAPIEIPNDWSMYVDEPLTAKELESIRRSVKRHCPYGDHEWQIKISKKLGVETTLRPRGRPKIKK